MNELELKKRALLLNTIDELDIGLIAYYRLNNNGKNEMSNNDLILENGATFSGLNKITGGACYENTVSGNAISTSNISLTQNQSWSFWIKCSDFSNLPAIIGNHISRDSNFWFRINIDRQIVIYYNNGIDTTQTYSTFPSSTINLNEWTHICITTDETKAYLYKNGKYISNIIFSVVPKFSPNKIVIGRYVVGTSFFKGNIDNIRVYNRTLNNNNAKEIYLRELTSRTNYRLISYARLDNSLIDEVSDSRVFTKVGSYNNINSISYDETNCYENVDPGRQGNYLISNDSVLLENQTMSCWFNPSIDPSLMPDGLMGIMGNYYFSSVVKNNFSIYLNKTAFGVSSNNNGTELIYFASTYAPVLNTWQHGLFNYNITTKKLNIYVNGKLLRSTVITQNPMLSSKKIVLGKWADGYQQYSTVGKLDNCRIYNIDVDDYTARKIFLSEVYSNTLTNGLVAYYKLNGNGNDEVSGNNLVLQGNATFNGDSYDNTKCYENNNTLRNQSAASTNDVLLSGDISMCCWFYANIDITSMQGGSFGAFIIGNHQINVPNLSDRTNYSILIAPTRITVLTNTGNTQLAVYPISYTFNTLKQKWYHVAYTFNITTKMHKLYLNGINVASASSTYIPATSNAKLLIGKWSNGHGDYTLTGKIDNARFYNRELTDLEVASIFKLEGGVEHDIL